MIMKKLLYIIIGLSLPVIASAQLQNLDFETWDYPINREQLYRNNPTGWVCSNRWFGYENALFNSDFIWPIDTTAQHNEYALRLSVWYNHTKDAALQTAPINYRPTALKGFYKYEDNFVFDQLDSIVDTAQVIVILSKWNTARAKRDTIGYGKLNIYKATSTFKDFQVPITYSSATESDTIVVFLDPSIVARDVNFDYRHGGSGTCSFFTLDNLSLVSGNTTGITDGIIPYLALTVHPNPTTDILLFETITGTMNIYNITGQRVSTFHLKDANSIDVSLLNKGVYFMVLNTEKEIRTSKFVKQ
jgi:hypothetical protein